MAEIIVVGHGAAGLSAALAAAEAARDMRCDARITLIEKTPAAMAGGNTRWSPSYMRLAALDRTAPGFEADMQAATGGRGDPAYFHALAAEAPAAVQWLARHGVRFEQPTYYLAKGPPRIQPIGGGAALVTALAAAARRCGVAIEYGCSADAIRLAEDGAVAGLDVCTDGSIGHRLAAAMILATGGFQGNAEMMRAHFGPRGATMRLLAPGAKHNTGDGIRLAEAVGAQRAGDWHGMHAEPIDPRSENPAPVVLVYPYGIVVDHSGRRFCDEGAGLVHETWEGFARHIQFELARPQAFAILDRRYREIEGVQRAIRSEVAPFEAASIAGLAGAAGIDPDGLAKTVAAYNSAATGDAARFDAATTDGLATAPGLRPPKSNWARAISTPPFYAYPLIGAIAYSFGGIATDPMARVLGAKGPIAGLFAAGETTGHFYATAPNAVAVLRAVVFGRIAGVQAIRDIAAAGRA